MRQFENEAVASGYSVIAGLDEAGRGPLAGPVVSASVIFETGFDDPDIKDSKRLSARMRGKLYRRIKERALCVATGVVENGDIDRLNILKASLVSMEKALHNLALKPDYLLIDGKFGINSPIPQKPVIKGDSRSISIAAASIVAKVERDVLMAEMHLQYPEYGFDRHKGYPTPAHKKAIIAYGPCPVHRLTFKGVKEVVLVE